MRLATLKTPDPRSSIVLTAEDAFFPPAVPAEGLTVRMLPISGPSERCWQSVVTPGARAAAGAEVELPGFVPPRGEWAAGDVTTCARSPGSVGYCDQVTASFGRWLAVAPSLLSNWCSAWTEHSLDGIPHA